MEWRGIPIPFHGTRGAAHAGTPQSQCDPHVHDRPSSLGRSHPRGRLRLSLNLLFSIPL
jgi:hypothetical protein